MIKFIEDKELCIKLKEKGFDEGCILTFRGLDTQPISQLDNKLNYEKNSEIGDESNYWLMCPTYCQVSEWLREKHKIFSFVKTDIIHGSEIHTGIILGKTKPIEVFCESEDYYDTYNKLIEESLKLI